MNNAASTPASPDDVYKKVFFRLLPFLVLCYFIASIDRGNVAYAKLQFQSALGFSESVYAIGASIFFLGYIMFEIPSNMLLKRIGIRKTLLRIMFAWGFLCACLAFMKTDIHYYTLRFFIGVAEAGFFPGVMYYLSKWAPPARRARIMAVFMASIGLSGALAGPIAGVIMTYMDGVGGMAGWQWLFILEGIPAMVLGVIAYFYLADSPEEAKWLSKDEVAVIRNDLDEEVVPTQSGSTMTLWEAMLNRRFIGLLFACFAVMSGTAAFMFWMPTIFRSLGVEGFIRIGLYSSGPFLVAVVVQLLNARSSDKRGERKFHIATGLLFAGVAWLVMAASTPAPAVAIVILTFIVAGTMSAMGPFWSLPATILPPEHRAVGIAAITTLGGLASFAQPILAGIIIDTTGEISNTQYLNGFWILGCVVLFLLLFKNQK